jgi:hypothetical protein
MEADEARVLVEVHVGDGLATALRPKDLDDMPKVLGGLTVGLYGKGGLVEEDDGVGVCRVLRNGLRGGFADPVRDGVRLARGSMGIERAKVRSATGRAKGSFAKMDLQQRTRAFMYLLRESKVVQAHGSVRNRA